MGNMSADINDSNLPPRARAGRRRGAPPPPQAAPAPPQAAPAPPSPELTFHAAAEQPCSDLDVLMGYQLFLGRDPENSFVISEAKNSPVRGFLRGLLSSGEFQNAVTSPLLRGQAMPHERMAAGPTPQQAEWLLSRLVVDAASAARLRTAQSWQGFWQALATLPGFPLGAAGADAHGPVVAAHMPDDGFMLITIEQPKAGDKLHPGALLSGSGWAIAPADITSVGVWLDDSELAQAQYGLPRPDVARNFPHYRHVDHCGFVFSVPIPQSAIIGSASQIAIEVRAANGQTTRRSVAVGAPVPTEPAHAGWPIRMFVEDVRIDADAGLRVRGWALSRAGIGRIAIHFGDDLLGEAEYGLTRPDIAVTHADYANAEASGFVFAASLRGHQAGPGTIRVQVTDQSGQQRQSIVPVVVPAVEPVVAPVVAPAAAPEALSDVGGGAPEASVMLHCDSARLDLDGNLSASGWVIADEGIADMTVLHGDTVLGLAELGLPRPDVARAFPQREGARQAGFRFDIKGGGAALQVGDRIALHVTLRTGATHTEHTDIDAAAPDAFAMGSAMRLEIDKPVLGPDGVAPPVRGSLTISGWAVAPPGIAEVVVFCDGQRLDQAYLGMRREDIASAYPNCAESLLAGFALVLPPGSIAEGLRRFDVTARSRSGEEAVRSFTVVLEPTDMELPGGVPRQRMPRAERAFSEAVLTSQRYHPRFAIFLPVPAMADAAALQRTLASVARQVYPRLAVVLVPENAAARRGAAAQAADCAALKGRISVAGGAAAAAGDLVMALQPGDELGCDALLELAVIHATDRRVDFIYADDHRYDAAHKRSIPFYKPDWSPELLLSMDYIGRPWVATAEVIQRARLKPEHLGKLGAYDAVLRLTEAAHRIRHLNKLLASTVPATSLATAKAALREAMARRGGKASVVGGPVAGVWRLKRALAARGLVSVIMPTAGSRGLVKKAIASLRATTPPGALEIVVLDNVPATDKRMKSWLRRNADRVVEIPDAFNWSRFNNIGAAASRGKYLLFLNDDIEALQPGWLEALLELAQVPATGVVGARLLYPDGKVQHAGQYLAMTHARHAFRFCNKEDDGPFGLARAVREMAAVTGACQMIRREVFDKLGGFDEGHDIINNDLDFCLRARQRGLSVLLTPHAELMHHELASRAAIEDNFDAARFYGAWRTDFLRGDPYHSRCLMAEADHTAPEPEPILPVHAGPVGPNASEVRRILAVKLDHIGDYLTSRPALRDLKRAFPKASLTLLAPPATAALARHEKSVDRVIEFTFFHARSGDGQRGVTAAEFAALRARLAPERFDIALDLRMQPETRDVLRHTGAGLLAGFDHKGSFPFLDVVLEWEGDQRLVGKHAHVSERLCNLVAAVATSCQPLDTAAVPAATDPRKVKALAQLPAAFLARPLVCVHPGVGNPVRQWPAASFAGLIDLLAADGLNSVIIGGGDEKAVAREVMDAVAAKTSVVSLAGAVSLSELADVMRACVIFVGNNSGPKHLAASLGVPTIGIHSGVVDAAEWAPLGVAAMALQRRVICGPCYLEFASDCPRGMACLTGITPRDVLAGCRRLLALRPLPARRAAARPPAKRRA
jgi:ADP-heptose:LPS heptosyltransferase/GT2 family glycosyltransferase